MRVQPTPTAVPSVSGQPDASAARVLVELVSLRDALAAGEMVNGQAAACLTSLLAHLSLTDLPTVVPIFPARLMPTRCIWCFGIDCMSIRCQTNHRSVTWVDCPACMGNPDGYYDPHCRHCYGYGWIEQGNADDSTPPPAPVSSVVGRTVTVPVVDGRIVMTPSSAVPADWSGITLRSLLTQRHWQTYRIFRREYDKAAVTVDPSLVGTWPSRAQFHRWLAGDLKTLPYADHCAVLEAMFPGHTAAELFRQHTPPANDRRPTLRVVA